MLAALDAVDALSSPPIPEAVLQAAMCDPSIITEDPGLLAAATHRGACLMERLAGPVLRLGPR